MLTLEEIAAHWQLSPATVRSRIRRGELRAVRIAGGYRAGWPDIWRCESGRLPGAALAGRYTAQLMTKSDLSRALRISVRTIDRLIASGLPTRNVGQNVRINRADASDWLLRWHGIELRPDGARIADRYCA